jgi:phosphoenolpyruvate synthase/pyruvate phosphate dikinase
MEVYWIGEPETGVTVEDVGGKSMNAIRAARLLDGREINDQELRVPDGFAVNGELQEEFLEEQRWKHSFLDRHDAMNILRPKDVDD